MHQKKLVFLGSKPIGFECLSYLLAVRSELNVEVSGILTNTRREFNGTSDLRQLAEDHGITIVEEPDDIPDCDILYSVQYNRILTREQIGKARQCAVNLHMAPLPEYRGANQFSFAILDEKKEFGTTIHLIDERIDHGDILFQERFPVPERCWVKDLYDLTFEASLKLFKQSLAAIINGSYTRVPQETMEEKYGSALHFRKEIDAIKLINLTWDKEKINRHIRAASMPGFEPPYYLENGKKVYISQEV